MENQSSGQSQRGGSGNFANDPERPSEAGKKGGQDSHGGRSRESSEDQQASERGGSGNFSNDQERAREAGRKGGEHSHGGSTR